MSQNTTLYIHTGIRKTATSWLQNIIFNKCPEINYIAKTDDYYPQWLIDWHYLDDFAFEQQKQKIKNKLTSVRKPQKVNLISSEAFTNTGVIHSQAYRIKSIYPNAKIIITLRNPIDTIQSHYRHDVSLGDAWLPMEEYLDYKRTPFVIGKRRSIYLPDFFYNEMVSLYNQLFDKTNVCILLYEDLIQKPKYFINQLEVFMGVNLHFDENTLNTKLNTGTSWKNVDKKKALNFHTYVQNHFPTVASKIKADDLLPDAPNTHISNKTKANLVEYYSGKATPYY